MGEIPDDRCGFVIDDEDWVHEIGGHCCLRPRWRESDSCIWHADKEAKPISELKSARIERPERLDGAKLEHISLYSDDLLQGCTLIQADISESEIIGCGLEDCKIRGADFTNTVFERTTFHNAEIVETDFSGADLLRVDFSESKIMLTDFLDLDLRESDFSGADIFNPVFSGSNLEFAGLSGINLIGADFSESNLVGADLSGSEIPQGNFLGAKLDDADLSNTEISEAIFKGSNLPLVDFSNATLNRITAPKVSFHEADFSSACVKNSNLENAEMSRADFTQSDVSGAVFTDADLSDSTFDQAIARDTTFDESNLEDATFIRTELRDANLRNTCLYQTLFSDTRINSNTDFGEKSAYEDPNTELGEQYEDTSRWEAAAWVYRRLQNLHEDNAMSEKAREYHIAKEEAQRREHRENGDRFQWGVHTANYHLTRHGENLWQVVKWSGGTIGACTLLYPLFGGIANSEGAHSLWTLSNPSIWDIGLLLGRSLYFSTVTFTTLGYGDYHPVGELSKALAGAESLAGALLVALFVFVLGRRVAR